MGALDDLRETKDKMTSILWTGRRRRGKVGVVAGGVLVAFWFFIGTFNAIVPPDEPTAVAVDTPNSSSSDDSCSSLRTEVEEYNTLDSGSSREGYLIGLHRLQRECPAEASAAGLIGEGLPRCGNDLSAENCTAYEGP